MAIKKIAIPRKNASTKTTEQKIADKKASNKAAGAKRTMARQEEAATQDQVNRQDVIDYLNNPGRADNPNIIKKLGNTDLSGNAGLEVAVRGADDETPVGEHFVSRGWSKGGVGLSDNLQHSAMLRGMAGELHSRILVATRANERERQGDSGTALLQGIARSPQRAKRMAEAEYHLQNFNNAIRHHESLHVKGDAVGAVAYLSKAADHLHDAIAAAAGTRPGDVESKTGVAPSGSFGNILRNSFAKTHYGEDGADNTVSLEHADSRISDVLEAYKQHLDSVYGLNDEQRAKLTKTYDPSSRSESTRQYAPGDVVPWGPRRSSAMSLYRGAGVSYEAADHPIPAAVNALMRSKPERDFFETAMGKRIESGKELFPGVRIPEGVSRQQHQANLDAAFNHWHRQPENKAAKRDDPNAFFKSDANLNPYKYLDEHGIQGHVDLNRSLQLMGLPTIGQGVVAERNRVRNTREGREEFALKDAQGNMIMEPRTKQRGVNKGEVVLSEDKETPEMWPKIDEDKFTRELGKDITEQKAPKGRKAGNLRVVNDENDFLASSSNDVAAYERASSAEEHNTDYAPAEADAPVEETIPKQEHARRVLQALVSNRTPSPRSVDAVGGSLYQGLRQKATEIHLGAAWDAIKKHDGDTGKVLGELHPNTKNYLGEDKISDMANTYTATKAAQEAAAARKAASANAAQGAGSRSVAFSDASNAARGV